MLAFFSLPPKPSHKCKCERLVWVFKSSVNPSPILTISLSLVFLLMFGMNSMEMCSILLRLRAKNRSLSASAEIEIDSPVPNSTHLSGYVFIRFRIDENKPGFVKISFYLSSIIKFNLSLRIFPDFNRVLTFSLIYDKDICVKSISSSKS